MEKVLKLCFKVSISKNLFTISTESRQPLMLNVLNLNNSTIATKLIIIPQKIYKILPLTRKAKLPRKIDLIAHLIIKGSEIILLLIPI